MGELYVVFPEVFQKSILKKHIEKVLTRNKMEYIIIKDF
jgi:hypothetical protein